VNQANKVKAKLETSLEELDDSLERERRSKQVVNNQIVSFVIMYSQDMEKEKRKLEGENKVAQETIDEIGRQKQDVENQMRK
jgi:myosin heavy chain 6/7